MAYDGLRAFVETLEHEGAGTATPELVRVQREVDPTGIIIVVGLISFGLLIYNNKKCNETKQ